MEHSWMTLFLFICVLSFSEAKPSLDIICKKEGRIVDADSCISYYNCVLPADKKLQAVHRTCPKGHGFSPSLLSCVPIEEVRDCFRRESRLNHATSKYNHLCDENGFLCANCKTLVYCHEGLAYSESCNIGEFCQTTETFLDPICYPKHIPECACLAEDYIKKDPYSSTYFLDCDRTVEEPSIRKCLPGMSFDESLGYCVESENFMCQEMGTFVDPADCRNYYHCIKVEDGWVRKKRTCKDDGMFNEEQNRCEDPCLWLYQSFTCEREGRFEMSSDCNKFYECTQSNGKLRKVFRKCPDKMHWQKSGMDDGFCVHEIYSKCSGFVPIACKMPYEKCNKRDYFNENIEQSMEYADLQYILEHVENLKEYENSVIQETPLQNQTVMLFSKANQAENQEKGNFVSDHIKKILDIIYSFHDVTSIIKH